MTHPRPKPDRAAPEDVAAFLRAHPSWLADHPEMYRVLVPPRRVHGDVLADHMAAMLRAERARAAELVERADGLLAGRRAAAGMVARVQRAVLALMLSPDPIDCLGGELPAILGLDAVALCVEAAWPGARPLPPGTLARLLGSGDVVFRDAPADAAAMHGEAARLARHDAVIRVPLAGTVAALALAARDRLLLESGEDPAALTFLGRAVGAALARPR